MPKIHEEPYYEAYLNLQEKNWYRIHALSLEFRIFWAQALQRINVANDPGEALFRWNSLMNHQFKHFITEIVDLYAPIPELKKMLLNYPVERELVSYKIDQIESLYHALFNLGLIDAQQQPEEEQIAQKIEDFLTTITDVRFYKYEHMAVQRAIVADKSNVIVLGVGTAPSGSSRSAEQLLPTFAQDLCKAGDTVSVYKLDEAIDFKNEILGTDLAARSVEGLSPMLFDMGIMCRALGQRTDFIERDEEISNRRDAYVSDLVEFIIDCYVDVLVYKAQVNPQFKLVLMDCSWSQYSEFNLLLAKKLLSTGEFALGENLELIHSYFDHSPAVIYRDFDKIPKINPILQPEERRHDDYFNLPSVDAPIEERPGYYDKAHEMYVFPRLQYIPPNLLFKLRPDSRSRHRLGS